jgi:hypothetical protein
MDTLSTLFDRFLRERRYLKNVTPKTVVWYETAFLALTRAVTLSGPNDLTKPLLRLCSRSASTWTVSGLLQYLQSRR